MVIEKEKRRQRERDRRKNGEINESESSFGQMCDGTTAFPQRGLPLDKDQDPKAPQSPSSLPSGYVRGDFRRHCAIRRMLNKLHTKKECLI